nr:unnamed protein product [Spirometra erinaceieuropaei]
MTSTISSDESELDITSIRKAPYRPGRLSVSTSALDSCSTADRQSLGLRAKKYLVPRLLSQRKLLMSLLNPLVAATLNDIHYLLKKSLDVDALIDILQELRQALLFLTERVFSEKSVKRVNFIFEELSSRDLWNSVFSPDATAEQRQLLLNLTTSFDRVLANKLL